MTAFRDIAFPAAAPQVNFGVMRSLKIDFIENSYRYVVRLTCLCIIAAASAALAYMIPKVEDDYRVGGAGERTGNT